MSDKVLISRSELELIVDDIRGGAPSERVATNLEDLIGAAEEIPDPDDLSSLVGMIDGIEDYLSALRSDLNDLKEKLS